MPRRTAFVKISGDLCSEDAVFEWIRKLVREYFVVICIGGGTQINKAFTQQGIPFSKHGPLGRETKTFKERQIARDVLEQNQVKIQDLFAARGITATVIIPVLDIGSVLCHVNGDIFVLTAYLGFDKVCVLTSRDRVERKKEQFARYPRIEVFGF